jgi:ribosomal protein S18 acetylase RimI-like enzyme
MLNIAPAMSPLDLADIRLLFGEYSSLVAEALCFQNFDQELAALPGDYVPPGGALLIARDADAANLAAGCVALRRIDTGTGEMKRMFVRESYRGSGLGRKLAVAVIEEARKRRYARIVLDTLPKLAAAIALYRDLGFAETGPYLASPTPGAICFELRIS